MAIITPTPRAGAWVVGTAPGIPVDQQPRAGAWVQAVHNPPPTRAGAWTVGTWTHESSHWGLGMTFGQGRWSISSRPTQRS